MNSFLAVDYKTEWWVCIHIIISCMILLRITSICILWQQYWYSKIGTPEVLILKVFMMFHVCSSCVINESLVESIMTVTHPWLWIFRKMKANFCGLAMNYCTFHCSLYLIINATSKPQIVLKTELQADKKRYKNAVLTFL